MVRWEAAPSDFAPAFRHDSGAVAWHRPSQTGEPGVAYSGAPEAVAAVLAGGDAGPVPALLDRHGATITAAAGDLLDAHGGRSGSWVRHVDHSWLMMWADREPADPGVAGERVPITPERAKQFLAEHYPRNWARPGAGNDRWLGWAASEGLVAIGSWTPLASGSVRLAGIATAVEARGSGYGAAITAALMDVGLAHGRGCTLGVIADNHTAIALYERLGFQGLHLTYVTAPRA